MKINFPEFHQAKVVVLGDVMLDRYWHGSTSRISPEAPVPVVNVGEIEERAGGAANVALNIASLSGQVTLVGLTGDDEASQAMEAILAAQKVNCNFQRDDQIPTTTKLRVMSRHQQLIRLDFEKAYANEQSLSALTNRFEASLAGVQAVVLSDYAKGALQRVQQLIAIARDKGIACLVDPKGNDLGRYNGATLVTPNFHEFEAIVGSCPDDEAVATKGEALRTTHSWQALLITRGEHGMSLLQEAHAPLHLPAHAKEVFDVTGAGDTVIATLAAGIAAGQSMAEATRMANFAASIVVGKLGTATVSAAELRRAFTGSMQQGTGIVEEDELLQHVGDCEAHNETVVMTNGCFDLLHPGHIAYLEKARNLGDRLIVAVNTDESIRSLKGDSRPINSLDHRMAVLAGMRSVDWVVPFAEDTPARLIATVKPDVLVKGGDYKVEDIAGAESVIKNGGQVKTIDLVEGCSTTRIIDIITRKEADSKAN
jgi:D-beta-D-heptose 7-phosphate kinase/D-beta-D-heptose 1-phosphate adenosyltransferase